jgi:pyruvate dehydrogenase E1 component alpha subunit
VVKRKILEKKYATEKDLEAIDQRIIDRVEESVKFAEESKYPNPSEALKDIYVQKDYPYITD